MVRAWSPSVRRHGSNGSPPGSVAPKWPPNDPSPTHGMRSSTLTRHLDSDLVRPDQHDWYDGWGNQLSLACKRVGVDHALFHDIARDQVRERIAMPNGCDHVQDCRKIIQLPGFRDKL